MKTFFSTISLFLVTTLFMHAGTRIVLVGDSTVTDDAGWGLGFKQFLDPGQVELINTARGGRSSMSFAKEGFWEKALALKGDYYLIQFGHNDEPGKPGRSTTLEEYRSNMNRYVDEARAIGAKPILVTSLVRRQFDPHDEHKINSSLAAHAAIVREIAATKHVPLIDLHERSKELCEKLGRQGCLIFSPSKTTSEGKLATDGTHLMGDGYVLFGRLVANELHAVVPELRPLLRDQPLNAHPKPAEASADAVVAFDGSGTHPNLQAAIDAAPDNGSKPFVIFVKSGTYRGQIIVPEGKPRLHLIGDGARETIATYPFNVQEKDEHGDKKYKGTGLVVLADDFTVER